MEIGSPYQCVSLTGQLGLAGGTTHEQVHCDTYERAFGPQGLLKQVKARKERKRSIQVVNLGPLTGELKCLASAPCQNFPGKNI